MYHAFMLTYWGYTSVTRDGTFVDQVFYLSLTSIADEFETGAFC